MPAVIYARFSSSAQREESIETQVRECKTYAKAHGLSVVKVYEDRAKSGRTASRPAFQRMIRDAERGGFSDLIVYTLDRFARNRMDSAMYKQRLQKAGVRIHYAKQDFGDGPESILIESMLEGYAEYYSASLSRGVKAGMLQNALDGKTNGGRAPYGYRHDGHGGLVIEPAEAEIIKLAFEWYDNGMSMRGIALRLNQEGRLYRGKPWEQQSFQRILAIERYSGQYETMGQVVQCPAIIDRALWERCRDRRRASAKGRGGAGGATVPYWLSGKVICGECGALMIGESGTGKSGQVYHYYKCGGQKRGSGCKKRPERKETLEGGVVAAVERDILTPDQAQAIAERTVRALRDAQQAEQRTSTLQSEIDETQRAIDGLMRAIELGSVSDRIVARLAQLEDQQRTLLARRAVEQMIPSVAAVRHYLLQSGDQRMILGGLVSRVRVYDTDDREQAKIEVECDLLPDRLDFSLVDTDDILETTDRLRGRVSIVQLADSGGAGGSSACALSAPMGPCPNTWSLVVVSSMFR